MGATPAWMHARAQWRTRRGALVVLALMIALGTATSLTALAAARRSATVVDRFVAAERTADVIVNLNDAPVSVVEQLRDLPGAEDVGLVANTEAFPEHAQGYVPLLTSIDGKYGIDIQRGVVREGHRSDPKRADEVMLSEQHAHVLGKHAGDPIVLRTFTKDESERCLVAEQQAPDCDAVFASPGGPRIQARVVAVLRTGVDLRNRDNEISLSYLTPAFHAAHPDLADDYLALVRLRDGALADEFVSAARRILPPETGATFDMANASPVEDAAQVIALGMLLFGVVAGLAATVACAQALLRQTATDSADRSVLSALGTTRAARLSSANLALLPSVVLGVMLGVSAAYVASGWMPIAIARRAEPSPGRQFDVLVLGLGALSIVVGLMVVAAASAWVVDRRAMHPRRPATRHVQLPAGNAAPRAVGLRYAFPSGRGAAPSRTAIAAIAAATAGVVAVIAFSASLDHLVHTPALYGWTFDAVGIDTDDVDAVRADPGVSGVVQVRAQLSLDVAGDPVYGYAIRPIEGDIALPIVRGREPRARDEVALGADTLSRTGAAIGDRVLVGGQDGQRNMRIVGQAVFLTDQDAYPLADGALVSFDAAAELGSPDSFDTLAVKFRPGDRSATERRLSKLASDGLATPRPPSEIEKMEQVQRLPQVLAGFMVLLGVVAIAHAMIVSVRRNRRDLGVLRALGFRGRDVGLAVAWQAVALAVVGGVLGLPVGIFVGRFVWRAIADGIGVRPVASLPPAVVAIIVPVTVLVAVLAALVPARRAARMHPTELLRSE